MIQKYKCMFCIFTYANAFLLPILHRGFKSLIHTLNPDPKFNEKVTSIHSPSLNIHTLSQHLYDMQWYVIGEPSDFSYTTPRKITVWNKDYVVWKTGSHEYAALDNACPHRGAAFSGGTVNPTSKCVVCPYHGYEFNVSGSLTKVPGVDLSPDCYTKSYDAARYDVLEDGGWVYLNTFPYDLYNKTPGSLSNNIYEDPERTANLRCVTLKMDYLANPRLLTENGLDISHIGFVHSFGNRDSPNPIDEKPPIRIGPNQYKTSYLYEAGPQSMAKVIFGSDTLRVENEFVLPHLSISRVRFADYLSTIITFATPITQNCTRLYVKNYRNFWKNGVGDWFIRNTMFQTMNEDRRVVEEIYEEKKNGKFNMKYDKLSNTYRTLYEKEYGKIKR